MQGSAEHAGVAAERTAERPLLPPQLMAALVLLSGLLLTLVLWDWSRDNERQDGQAHFDRLAERIETELLRRLHLPTYGIHGARGVYAASANVSLEEFRAYVEARQPAQEFPGVRGFGFIERVMRADAPRFVARMRVELGPDFELRGGEASGAPDHYVIKYIEPLAANRAAWGLDLGAEAVRRAAIERAVALAKDLGAKRAVLLPVSAPFHCPLMQPAADAMDAALADARIAAPLVPVFANVDAAAIADPSAIRVALVRQVTGMVRWRESVLAMVDAGVTQFVEFGGKVLSPMVKRIAPDAEAISVVSMDDVEDLLKKV